MARLTETQRRRMRDLALQRKRMGRPPYTNQEMAMYLGVTYNETTWVADTGYNEPGGSPATPAPDTAGYVPACDSTLSTSLYDNGTISWSSSDSGTSCSSSSGGCD